MFAAAVDQRRHDPPVQRLDPPARQRKAGGGEVDGGGGQRRAPGQPGFHHMTVAGGDVHALSADLGAHEGGGQRALVLRRLFLRRRVFGPQQAAAIAERSPSSRLAASARGGAEKKPVARRCAEPGAKIGRPKRGHAGAQKLGRGFDRRGAAQGVVQRLQPGEFGGERRIVGAGALEREHAGGVEFAVERRLKPQGCFLRRVHLLSPNICASAARARARRDMTVPTGACVAAAMSR